MFAIVYKSDGVPICVQVPGVSPDPVVVWTSENAAKAFIESKSGAAEFQPVSSQRAGDGEDGQGARLPGREAHGRAVPFLTLKPSI